MKREIESKIIKWFKNDNKALLISGARQVGKTYIIRESLKNLGIPFFEVNFILNQNIKEALNRADTVKEIIGIFKRNSKEILKEKESVIFLDEVQEYPDIITKIKFLVDEGSFKFIKACGVNDETDNYLRECFKNKTKVDELTHNKMIDLFYTYLVTGGLPDVINTFFNSSNLIAIHETQKNIVNLYKSDFSKYENEDRKLRIIEIFDNIPAQLNKQNLKFVFKYLNKELKFDRYENSFLWLKEAGVAYPIFNVTEVRPPLLISKEKNSFKFFMNDVGLLNSYYSIMIKQALFEKNADHLLNLGGLFESFVASTLKANGFDVYYYRNKNIGEIDFLVEKDNKIIPIEVKSGSDYKKHSSLNKLLASEYKKYLNSPYVLSTNNLEVKDNITYLPIYMTEFIKHDEDYDYFININI